MALPLHHRPGRPWTRELRRMLRAKNQRCQQGNLLYLIHHVAQSGQNWANSDSLTWLVECCTFPKKSPPIIKRGNEKSRVYKWCFHENLHFDRGITATFFFAQNDDERQTTHHVLTSFPFARIAYINPGFYNNPPNCVLAEISSSWTLSTCLRVTTQMIQAGLSNMRLT